MSNPYASICQPSSTDSGSLVRRWGATATSSNEYPARADFERPITMSLTRGKPSGAFLRSPM